jgi:hypothetical protein
MVDFYSVLMGLDYMTAALVAMAAALIVWGFWPLAVMPRSTPGVRSLARAILLLTFAMGLRTAYWSLLVPQEVREKIGKAPPSIVFSTLLLFGAYYMLRVLHLTIPEAERSQYSLLTAALYPRRWRTHLAARIEAFLRRARGD